MCKVGMEYNHILLTSSQHYIQRKTKLIDNVNHNDFNGRKQYIA